MSVNGLGLRRHLLAGFVGLAVVCPALVSADEIRILFVVPRDAGLQAQVEKLERAIRERQGPLVVAESLADAHVAIQLTGYRRSIDKGEPSFHWLGQARLLKQPEEMTVSATPLPEHFELLAIGDGRETDRALTSLALMLSKTLRPRAHKPVKEAV